MSVLGLEKHLKRKTPSKEDIRSAQESEFQRHEPQAIIRYKIVHHPYGIRPPHDARDWAHLLLTPEGKAIVEASKREDVQKEIQRISTMRLQADRQSRIQKEKDAEERHAVLNDPLFKLCQMGKYRNVPAFRMEFEGLDKESQIQACKQFPSAASRGALNPPLSRSAIDFLRSYCMFRLQELEKQKPEDSQSLLKKVGEMFRWH